MNQSTISARGRTTVPRAIRKRIGAGTGTRLRWQVLPGGLMAVHVATEPSVALAGSTEAAGGKVSAVDKPNGWR